MIVVDSSVWIDYFRDRDSAQVRQLDRALGTEPVAIADLVLTEVLQGYTRDDEFERARRLLSLADPLIVGGQDVALQAAMNYRHLRSIGVTIRKTIDTLIATRCIIDRLPLLYSDRDFDPFVRHLGLENANYLPE